MRPDLLLKYRLLLSNSIHAIIVVNVSHLLMKDKLPNVFSSVGAGVIVVARKSEVCLEFGLLHSILSKIMIIRYRIFYLINYSHIKLVI